MKVWPWVFGGGVAAAIWYLTKDTVSNLVIESTRTPDDILNAVAAVNPEGNPDLQPGANGGASWCNKFVALVTAQLGVPIIWGEWGTRANDQINWLQEGNGGWYPASKADAQAAALAGHVALATYFNLNPPPHDSGHMALVLPYQGAMQIAQAGAHNFNQVALNSPQTFGSIQPDFFVHD